jgi:hypothetical protein
VRQLPHDVFHREGVEDAGGHASRLMALSVPPGEAGVRHARVFPIAKKAGSHRLFEWGGQPQWRRATIAT